MESFPTKTSQQIRQALESTAQDLGLAGRDDIFENGLVQADHAYDFLAKSSYSSGTSGDFGLAPNLDLCFVKKRATGTGRTEVHVLSKKSNYQSFSLQTGTALHETR